MTPAANTSRRRFLQQASTLAASAAFASNAFAAKAATGRTKVSAHIWVYASKFPPKWDLPFATLDQAFSDLSYAGFDGVELKDVTLAHDEAVYTLHAISNKYKLPITGSAYAGNMWDASQHDEILRHAELVIQRLGQLGGVTLGTSVGDAKRLKTDAELDAQAVVLKAMMEMCGKHGITLNLHNHIYEIQDGMHDLKGTLARVPGIKLGPDMNWLIRSGVDPISFIHTYGSRIVYMHLRDQYADGTWTEYVGQGVTNFPGIAAALKAEHFHGRAAIELAYENKFTPTQPLRESWKMSREYVRRTFGW